jgi:hypothetical protein
MADMAKKPSGTRAGLDMMRPEETSAAEDEDGPIIVQEPAEIGSNEEQDAAMLPHVHPPHHGTAGWRGFLGNVATIVVGLIIAVALEQTVEFFHHEHLRAQLEEGMHEVFQGNRRTISEDLTKLNGFRSYLVDQQAALIEIRQGKTPRNAPRADDRRFAGFLQIPGMGPFEASKANGTVALLDLDRLRIYSRIELQHDLLRRDMDRHMEVVGDLRTFRKRFNPSPDNSVGISLVSSPSDRTTLIDEDLREYQRLLGAGLDATDKVMIRLQRLDAMGLAVMRGAKTEREVVEAAMKVRPDLP